jgi:sugar lactone lactonase YvrE
LWVDIMAGKVHATDPASGVTVTRELPLPVGCIAPRVNGGLIAGAADGFWSIPERGQPTRLVAVEADRRGTLFNDGRCDRAGRFWAGTMAYDLDPGAGSLYRLDPDLTVRRVLSRVTVSNGIDWSPDGHTMYYVDTGTRRIDCFDFDVAAGSVTRRRPFAKIEAGQGDPDGLTVDSEGGIWVALWGGWAIRRYHPSGDLDAVVELPTSMVTSVAFGGVDLRDLFVTTARRPESPEDAARQPHAGGVFRLRVDVPGRLPNLFAR